MNDAAATKNELRSAPHGVEAGALVIPPRLAQLWKRGADFLGCPISILAGAMSWVSERHLVAAISNAGGFGVIACGAMTPALLDTEIKATRALTKKPFGVNLITMHPQLMELVDVCQGNGVTHVVFAGGVPPGDAIKKAKTFAKVLCFAPAVVLAKRLIKNGADALVIEGSEAGGHIGPVSTSVLAQEILPAIRDVPVFVAGGIGRGEAIVSFLEMGAAGVQMGTRFVCASESIAHPKFKQAFIRAAAREAVTSVQLDKRLPVIPVRALANQGTELFMETQRKVLDKFVKGEVDQQAAQLEIEHFWAGALRRAVIDGDVEFGSMMAGQSVGMVTREEPVTAIMAELIAQAGEALAARGG
ncbi:MAG: nitronate monooxygenase [Rhodospirillaceae bacterium]|nr:nitronate monooxygenase [Rhodospirillaceae bacterium]